MFCGEICSNLQVFDEFSTGTKVLLNYLVTYMSLCTVCFKLFKLEGGVLQYIFLVIFPLLVSSKLDSYDEYAPT